MANRPGIWNRLQEYEVTPPGELSAYLLDHTVGEAGHQEEPATAEPFRKLEQYEVQPPAFLKEKIGRVTDKKSLSFYMYRAAAACVLLVIAGVAVYKLSVSKLLPPGPGKQMTARNAVRPAAATAQPDSLSAKDTATDVADAMAKDSSLVTDEAAPYAASFTVDGRKLSLVDNDLLTTFASFSYTDIPVYISRPNDRIVRIHIDRYANIFISKTMVEMMRDLYEVKSNGKPTRKAKRTRSRMDGWKKSDQKRFDSSALFNPLDPVDLGGFIFK